MPIAVLSEYTEKEYEPFDPYSRFYPAMPISVCFSDTALYTLGKLRAGVFCLSVSHMFDRPRCRDFRKNKFFQHSQRRCFGVSYSLFDVKYVIAASLLRKI